MAKANVKAAVADKSKGRRETPEEIEERKRAGLADAIAAAREKLGSRSSAADTGNAERAAHAEFHRNFDDSPQIVES